MSVATTLGKKILIIGGVAGGASAAARLRRLDEHAQITIFERGEFPSFANCGLPYYIGGVISKQESLIVATSKLFLDRFNVEIKNFHEVIKIDKEAKNVEVKNLRTGVCSKEPYDTLVMAPGAAPIIPPIQGIKLPGIFTVRTIPDASAMKTWIETHPNKSAVVVGGGFIGLEMAENLHHLGVKVTVLEGANQVMPPVDLEMASVVAEELHNRGIDLILSDPVSHFEEGSEEGSIVVISKSGRRLSAGMVVLAIGVRPDVHLAAEANLKIGERGGITIDDHCRTSDENIFAVGDAVEVDDFVTHAHTFIPLAGPANRQGRVAADNISGKTSIFRGVQGTAICGVFGVTVAMTGLSEKAAARAGISGIKSVRLHAGHHASYFPGAEPIHLKVLFDEKNGRVVGAQAVGTKGVAKRIDVISMAIQMKGTMQDLAECELCYAPQFGAAKDPVNIAGFIGTNFLNGDSPLSDWDLISKSSGDGEIILDVREPREIEIQKFERASGPEAICIPLHQLRQRFAELPTDKPINVLCRVGQRGYNGVRVLRQLGFDARLMSGGLLTWRMLNNQTLKF